MKNFVTTVALALIGLININPAYSQLNKAYFFYKGEELLAQQKYTQALPYLNTLIGIDSSLFEGWFLRGVAKYNLGDIPGAIADFDKTIKVNPVFAQGHHYKSIALNRISQPNQALNEIDIALDLKPNSSEFLFTLGIIHFQMENYTKAIEVFSKVLRIDNSNPDVWINRGSARLLTGDTLGALSDYNLAIKVNPFYANSYSRRGILNAEINKHTLALADLDKAIALDSLGIDNYFNRALVYHTLKQPTKALSDLNRVLRADPKYSLALFNRAIISYQIGDWEKAIDDLTRLTSLNPENVLIYYYRGSILYEKGQLQTAINDYTTAINIFPDFANAYINRAEIKSRLGDAKGAETDYNTGKSLLQKYKGANKDNPFAMLDSSGKFKHLISLEKDFNTASRLSLETNRFVVTSAFLPMLKLCLNKETKIQNSHNAKSAWLDSINSKLPYEYQLTLSTQPDNRAKELSLHTIDSLFSGNPYRSLLRGILLTAKGRYSNATQEFKNAVKESPYNPLIEINLIASNTDMARFIEGFNDRSNTVNQGTNPPNDTKNQTSITAYSEATAQLSQLPALDNSSIIAYNIGNLHILTNNFTEAINWYNKAITMNSSLAGAYYNRGLALLLSGSKQPGCQDLSTAGEMGVPQAYEALQRFCGK
ncbi:MAG: tetratricopeptide repeat protein [Bacteroidales bacterium]|nr:tetratricopeptide repeat protein [Bacteroidales bacterium]